MFLLYGKPAFLAQEVSTILEISKPTDTLRRSKALESAIDYDIIPAVSLPLGGKFLPTYTQHVAILYLSRFFLFVLRSNKPIAMPFTRWAIREEIPMAMMKNDPPEVTKDDLKLMELASKHKSKFVKQLLIQRGFVEASSGNKQLSFGDDGEVSKGGV